MNDKKRINKQVRLRDWVREISLSVCELLFTFFRVFSQKTKRLSARHDDDGKGQKRMADNVLLSLHNYNVGIVRQESICLLINYVGNLLPCSHFAFAFHLYSILILIIAIQTLIRTL